MMTATRTITIELAEVEHIDKLAPLLDAYRIFYGQPGNLPAAAHFLFERMINHESVIYLAMVGEEAVGFVQLYPGFSTVSLRPEWRLNDLYVRPEWRRQGVARKLIEEAKKLVRDREDKGLVLETAHSNAPAQRIYESLGFVKDQQFATYYWLNE